MIKCIDKVRVYVCVCVCVYACVYVCVCVYECTCFCQSATMRIGRSNTASCANTYKCLVSYWLPPFDKQHTVLGSHLEN